MNDWTAMLAFDLDRWLDHLRRGNIRAAIDAAGRWHSEVVAELERRGLDVVPDALRYQERQRAAVVEALENHRVTFVSMHPATADKPGLWRWFLSAQLGMTVEEFTRWWERERAHLIEQQERG